MLPVAKCVVNAEGNRKDYELRLKVSHSSMLLYQDFLEKYIIEICRQNKLKKYKDNGGSVSIPLSYGLFNLTFSHLKCNFILIRICCQYFWLSKLISSNIVFNYAQWSHWIEGLRKKIVRSCINFCVTFLHLK